METLNDQQKKEWRHHHIPSRLRAAMAHTRLDPEVHQRELGNFAAEAVQMGRAIAIRWLIEFVGISWDNKNQHPKRAAPQKDGQRIDNLGENGDLIYPGPGNSTALQLGRLWSAASKAVSHATCGSNPAVLTDESIADAVEVLKNHLQATLYAKHLEDLDAFIHNSAN